MLPKKIRGYFSELGFREVDKQRKIINTIKIQLKDKQILLRKYAEICTISLYMHKFY